MDPEKASIEQKMHQDEGPPYVVPGSPSEASPMLKGNTYVQIPTCSCQDPHHRKLAIGSIICGLTCLGIVSLINSVKASQTSNAKEAEQYSKKARKYAILSIAVWVTILIMLPVFVVFGSFLVTLID